MKNKRGKTVTDRLNEEIEYAENTNDVRHRDLLATKALGAVDFAVEYGLITYKEWELYIERLFKLM